MADVSEKVNDDQIRKQLIALATKKGCRKYGKNEWTREEPIAWIPDGVKDPESGMGLTDHAAWELILRWLKEDCPIEPKEFTLASGKKIKAHVMKQQFGNQMVYVKLQIIGGGRFVKGWSFHISEWSKLKE